MRKDSHIPYSRKNDTKQEQEEEHDIGEQNTPHELRAYQVFYPREMERAREHTEMKRREKTPKP